MEAMEAMVQVVFQLLVRGHLLQERLYVSICSWLTLLSVDCGNSSSTVQQVNQTADLLIYWD